MATYIPNQPVLFTNSDTPQCVCDEQVFEQLVDFGDTTQFQMLLSECGTGTNLITDPNFESGEDWDIDVYSNWSITENLLCSLEGVIGDTVANPYSFDVDKYYKIVVIVDSMSVGGSIGVYLGETYLGSITSTGTYNFYDYPELYYGDTLLRFVIENEGTSACISEADAYEILLNNIVAIYDKDGNFNQSISFEENPEYFTVVDNKFTVNINWAELEITGGCYYLCWMDACSNNNGQNYPAEIQNCGFTSGSIFWTVGTYWSIAGSQATGSSPAGPTFVIDRTLSQDFVLTVGINNCVTIVITSITGRVLVYFGGALIETITTAGTHIICGVCTDSEMLALVLDNSTNVVIDSVCPTEFNPEEGCDYTSNTFKLSSFANNCTELISIANNGTGFGFEYTNSSFLPSVRIEAKVRQSSYKGERVVSKDSKGGRKVHYFDATKYFQLVTGQLPEYIHDFLRLAIGSDRLLIGTADYYMEDDEYQVIRDQAQDEYGYVNILIARNNQNVKNINCQSSETDNTCGGNLLLLEDNESISL